MMEELVYKIWQIVSGDGSSYVVSKEAEALRLLEPLYSATKRVEELEAALTTAIAHCKEATVSPAGRHVVEQAIMEMRAALAGKGE